MAHLADMQPAYDAFDEANTLARKSEYATAILNLEKAIQIEPAEARFYGLKGDIYLAQKKYPEADREFSKALQLDDTYYEYYLGRGLSKSKRGMVQEARDDLNRSTELLPTSVAANELGEISLALGDRVTAKNYFQSAMVAGGPVGSNAEHNFLKLDVADSPAKYLRIQAQLSESRELVAILANDSPAKMSDVAIEFLATLNGQPVRRIISVTSVDAGASGSVSSGWTISETDQLENLNIKVVSATANF